MRMNISEWAECEDNLCPHKELTLSPYDILHWGRGSNMPSGAPLMLADWLHKMVSIWDGEEVILK